MKWAGYDETYNSWEPKENLECNASMLEDYEKDDVEDQRRSEKTKPRRGRPRKSRVI